MRTRRTVAIALFIAVVACAFVLSFRSFAQTGPYDISLPNWQKLKAPYDEDSDAYEKNILKKHSKKYCVTHRKKDGTEKKHCPKSSAAALESEIIPVASSATPLPIGDKPLGSNVTQNISCATAADKEAILATFD
jgi:hypothetical protein